MSMEGQPGRLCQYQTAFSAFGSCLVDLMVDPNPKFSHESNISLEALSTAIRAGWWFSKSGIIKKIIKSFIKTNILYNKVLFFLLYVVILKQTEEEAGTWLFLC